MNIFKLGVIAAGLLAALSPAHAAPVAASAPSPATAAFLANLDANVVFLDRSSHLVSTRTGSPAVRAFAGGGVFDAVRMASILDEVRPVRVAVAEGAMQSGRSVAIDGAVSFQSTPAANGRTPPGAADLARLSKLSGRAFENLYWEKQLDALSQIEADYRTYISRGDDPVLVALARDELPKIMQRLTALTKI